MSEWPFEGLKRNHYKCILADPATDFIAGKKGRPQHYDRMRDHEIAALPVRELAHPDGAWLWLWATSPKLYKNGNSKTLLRPDEIAKAWGFRYSGNGFVWVKLNSKYRIIDGERYFNDDSIFKGMGYGTRKTCEFCLLFRIGTPSRLDRGVGEVIISPRREHSRKPDEQYERIERFCEGPRVELFARASRPGWETWGNESNKFDEAA